MSKERISKKNVWLKTESTRLLKEAKIKYVNLNKDPKPTDDKVIEEALKNYLNS